MRRTLPNCPGFPASEKKWFKRKPGLCFYLAACFIVTCLSVLPAFAQNVNTYDFAQNIGTFTPLIPGTGPTAVPAIKANDAISAALPIGFTFNYAGGNYTNVYASSNGFLTFFGASSLPNTSLTALSTASTGSMAIIAPAWADLNYMGAPGAAAASYQTTGTPGNRVFTFQWLNWQWGQVPNAGSNTQDISFQVKLYEGTDKIEFYYRQEALNSSILNNHAAIGLAGPSTGAPDFLFVRYPASPPTSITTEGGHNLRPPTGQIYTFTKSALKDIQAVGLAYPTVTTCGPNIPVSVTIKNMGGVPLDFSVSPLTITGAVAGPNPATFNVPVTGTLAVNASIDVVVLPNYDMTAGGTYTFNATANLTGDGRPNNDAMPAATRTVAPIATVPQFVNFTGYNATNLSTVFPGWTEELLGPPGPTNGNVATGLGSATNITARFQMGYGGASFRWIKSPKVVVTASTQLRYKVAITEAGTFNAKPNAMPTSDDEIFVMISSDCGTSFTPLFTHDASNSAGITNVLTEQIPISLAAYAGQTVIIGFYMSNGTLPNPMSYDFHLDDISIATPPATDLGVLSMQNPIATGCYSNAENVTITVKNFGSNAIDFATKPAQVQARVTGNATPIMLSTTLTTGTLAPGATQVVTLQPALNMLGGGTYNFKAYTTIAGDNNALNDTLTISRYNAPTFALPNSVDFTGYVVSRYNLSTLFPGWWRTTGVTPDPYPMPNPGTWDAWTGLGHPANKTAVVNLWDSYEKGWMIGPKIAATPITEFRFKVAITEYPNTNPYPLGMSGTDDKVQVMVSTDCGVSYFPIYTIDASNSGNITNVLSEIVVPLGSFAGQDIIIAIFATDGAINNTNNYFFHIDDLVLRNAYSIDVTPVKAVTKMSGCGLTSTEQVCVVVKNESLTAQSNIPVSFRVNNGAIVSEVISGPIQSMDTLRYCFTGTANFAANGTYNLEIFTGLTTDVNTANDTIRHTLVSYTPAPLTSASGDTRCGPGPVTLTAVAPNNLPVNWYTASTGGTLVGSGSTFTPNVSATTTYYAGTITGVEKVGKLANEDTHKAGGGGGLYFDATQTFDLKSVVVYTDNTTAQNITIRLTTPNGTALQNKTFNLPAVSGKTAVTVPLDFNNIAPGTDYRLVLVGTFQLYRDQVTATNPIFPFVSPSQTVTITDGTFSGFYNYFYDWTIAVCSSAQRTQVVATVNPLPAVNLDPNITQCSANPVLLDAGNAGSTFQWSMNGTAISGATNQTFSATTPGTYSVMVTNASNCSATGTVQVSHSTVATPTVTAAGPLTFCQGGSVTLTGATATTGVTYQWLLNNALISGATSATFSASAPGNYRLVASLSGCSDTSAVTTVTVNTKPATPVITVTGGTTTICPGSTVTLNGTSATSGVSYSWSLNGALLPGATAATYTTSTPGNYRVIATSAAGCADSSAVTAITASPKPATPTISQTGTTLTASASSGTYQWYSVSGTVLTPVSGATAATFTPTASGSYTVIVTENGCESEAATATNIVLGVGSLAPGMDISIFPNPTAGKFLVALTGFEKEASIELLSITGQHIASEKIAMVSKEKTVRSLDLSGMAKGVYLLKVISGKNVTIRKVILE